MVPHYKLPRRQSNTIAEQIGHYSERTSVRDKMPTLWHSRALIFLFLFATLLTSCGGGSSNPPPAQDFTLSVSTAQIVATVGTVSPPFSVSIAGKNGFSDSATITLSGLPPGATSQPASPFTVTSDSTSLDVPGESCLRNPLREICTVGSVREEFPVVPWWT